MLVDLFDIDSFHPPLGMNGIDRAIGIAEPHSSIALPFTLERVISKPWYRARSRKAFNAHEVYPESKLSDDVCWNLGELLSRGLRQLDLRWSSVPLIRVQSSPPGPVAWRLLGAQANAPRLVRHTK